MKLIYVVLIFLFPAFVYSQSIQLRGKVIDINKQPIKNLSIRFTSFGEKVTTGSGEFVISIPQNVNIVDVVIRDSSWQLVYPFDAKIPVPVDPYFITTLIVSGSSTSSGTSLNESHLRYTNLEELLKDEGTSNTEIKATLEKFIELESKRLEISELELKEEFEKQKMRIEIFSKVSPVLKEYLLRVKNLKTSFEMNYESAFISNPSVEYLNNAISLYNPSFDTIYNNYNKWQKEISIAWDEVLSESFAASVNYMIDEIHKTYIFQLNEDIRIINNVKLRIGEGESRPDELKEEVIQSVSSILKNLEIKIPILENRFNEILTRMQHSGMN